MTLSKKKKQTEEKTERGKISHGLFSLALFKQSWKANGLMWGIITFCTCLILAFVMVVSGGGSISDLTTSLEDEIISQTLDSQIQSTSLTYYNYSNDALEDFDNDFIDAYEDAYLADPFQNAEEAATKIPEYTTSAYTVAVSNIFSTALEITQGAYPDLPVNSDDFRDRMSEIAGVLMFVINPNGQADNQYNNYEEGSAPGTYDVSALVSNVTSEDYASWQNGEEATNITSYLISTERMTFRADRSEYSVAIMLGGNMTSDTYIDVILESLSDFGITKERYLSYGFDYDYVKHEAATTIVTYRARYDYELSLIDRNDYANDEEYYAAIKEMDAALRSELSSNILTELPENVATALEEIGELDLYGLIVGTIFYKVAGLLLPIIFIIMVSNGLIAGQVDSGSMAYVLSTSTKRNQIVFTQAIFMVTSLFLMFVCTSIVGCCCLAAIDLTSTSITFGKLIMMNVGAFITMIAIAGINFLTSCWFDRSKRSMALGGGLSMFFLVATMLGLFGSPVVPSVVRMDALNGFNYVSIITLFDVVSIINGTLDWVWQIFILLAIGIAGFIIGSWKFKKKDLPL